MSNLVKVTLASCPFLVFNMTVLCLLGNAMLKVNDPGVKSRSL